MDNRVGDRHLNRVRNHKSGAEKRKQAREEKARAESAAAKSRKIKDYYSLVKSKSHTPGSEVPVTEQEDGEQTETNRSTAEDSTVNETANSMLNVPVEVINDITGGNDIGLWPAIIPEIMRKYWLRS